MLTFTQSFLLFALVYASAFFFITNISYDGLNIQDDPDFKGAKTFFMAHEVSDDFEILGGEEEKFIEFNEDAVKETTELKPEETFEFKVKVIDEDTVQVQIEETAQEKVKEDTVKDTTWKTGSDQGNIAPISDEIKPKPIIAERPTVASLPPPTPNIRPNPFEMLGAYPDPSPYVQNPTYDKPHYGIVNSDRYCHEVDIYNLANPSNMFKRMHFLTDFHPQSIVRTRVLSKIGAILNSQISRGMQKNLDKSRKYLLDKRITSFHIAGDRFYKYHEIGKHYLCATQMFNHIPNHTTLIRKDEVLQNIADYSLMYKDKPQCFDKNSFFPETYRLFVKQECKDFFKLIQSEKYKDSLKDEPIQYLLKVGHGAHKAQGVFLLDPNETKSLNFDYKEGEKCGEVTKPWIAQKYITNPLLLDNNNKFHMRVYVLIASTNPFIVYYHDGYIRASIFPFDKRSEDRATHLTNLLVGDQVAGALNNDTLKGMTPKQLEDYYLWSFEDLAKYLLESGKITDANWLDNHLRPALQKAFVHIVRMTGGYFWKQSNVFEMFGCDFMIDDEMNVWFIEANPNPLLDGVKPQMITTMLKDLFEIEYSYYRSRMKRVLNVIQKMEKENGVYGPVKELSKWKGLYQTAVKNRLEPEYKIQERNTWKLIMDESRPGAQAYLGYIPEECVNQE